MAATGTRASQVPALAAHAQALSAAVQAIDSATRAAWSTGKPSDALANAVPYMQAFGHVVLAWIWLDVALAVVGNEKNAINSIASKAGKLSATVYFYHYELPKIGAWLNVVQTRDQTCANMSEDAF